MLYVFSTSLLSPTIWSWLQMNSNVLWSRCPKRIITITQKRHYLFIYKSVGYNNCPNNHKYPPTYVQWVSLPHITRRETVQLLLRDWKTIILYRRISIIPSYLIWDIFSCHIKKSASVQISTLTFLIFRRLLLSSFLRTISNLMSFVTTTKTGTRGPITAFHIVVASTTSTTRSTFLIFFPFSFLLFLCIFLLCLPFVFLLWVRGHLFSYPFYFQGIV